MDEEILKHLDNKANKAFDKFWKDLQEKQAFPDTFFTEPKVKYMFGVVFFSAFEAGWNECVLENFKDSMKEIEFAMSELVEVVTHLKNGKEA